MIVETLVATFIAASAVFSATSAAYHAGFCEALAFAYEVDGRLEKAAELRSSKRSAIRQVVWIVSFSATAYLIVVVTSKVAA